jgi:hypothetical protein
MVNINYKVQLTDSVPNQLPSFSLRRPRVNQKAIKDSVKKMKFKLPIATITIKPEFRYVDNWTIYKHYQYTYAKNRKSGGVRFRDEIRHGKEADKSLKINKPKLDTIAREYINKTKFLKEPVDQLSLVKITYLKEQGASIDGTKTEEIVLDAGVIYQKQIENLPVIGGGGYTMINIAHDETVVAGEKVWRDTVKAVPKQKIITPDEAKKELEKRLKRQKIINADVVKADFGYFEADVDYYQRYIDPSYGFIFESKVGEITYSAAEIIPAVKNPKQKIQLLTRYKPPTQNRT